MDVNPYVMLNRYPQFCEVLPNLISNTSNMFDTIVNDNSSLNIDQCLHIESHICGTNNKKHLSKNDYLFLLNFLLENTSIWSNVSDWEIEMRHSHSNSNIHSFVAITDNTLVSKHQKIIHQQEETLINNKEEETHHNIEVSITYATDTDYLNTPTEISKVTITHRKRFYFVSNSINIVCWYIECSQSWSGKTKDDAEKKLLKDDTDYSIKCVCMKPMTYITTNIYRNWDFLILSLLLKTKDLLDVLVSRQVPTQSYNYTALC